MNVTEKQIKAIAKDLREHNSFGTMNVKLTERNHGKKLLDYDYFTRRTNNTQIFGRQVIINKSGNSSLIAEYELNG